MIQELQKDSSPETSITSDPAEPTGHPQGTKKCKICDESLEFKRFSYSTNKNGHRYYGSICYSCKDTSRKNVRELKRFADGNATDKTINEIHRIYYGCLSDSSLYPDAVACIPELIETVKVYRKAITILMQSKNPQEDLYEVLPNDEFRICF